MDVECLIRKIYNKDYNEERTAEEIDEVRHKTLAYDYLCHLEEARIWIESCLKENLPPTTELEENLRNGVYLAKLGHFIAPEILPKNKIYDIEQKRYKIAGLQFRHTDNIHHFLEVLKTTELPHTFHPETTDVYGKKNMPRVIYCIHALSTHLFKLGRAPLIQDLYGKATFTDEEIDTMSKELRRYGITMPAFQKIGGLLSSNLDGDVAALHAAVINVNQAIDSDSSIESSLLNPAVKLKHVLPELLSDYYAVLKEAKKIKVRNTLNRSMNDSYIPDVYDELLTQGEIQGYVTSVNFSYTWRKAIEAAKNENGKALMHHLKSDWLQLKYLKCENVKYYMEEMKTFDKTLNETFSENVTQLGQKLQISVNRGNSKADTHFCINKAVKSVNKALECDGLGELYRNLLNLRKYTSVNVDEFSLPLLYEEMKLDKIECGEDLSYEDILNSTQVLTSIANVSKAADQCSSEELWCALGKSELPVEGLHPEFSMSYCQTIMSARRAKMHADLPCPLLTLSDIQDCIDEVNQHEGVTEDLIYILNEVNDAVSEDDAYKLMSALNNEKLNVRESLFVDNIYLYLKYFKSAMRKKVEGELWLEDIKSIISQIAEETLQVKSVCNLLTKVNLAVLQIDASGLLTALDNSNFQIFRETDVNRNLFETFLEYFESKNTKNPCPWIVHHTKSGKTVYVNIETNSYSWDTPKDFKPQSRYLSMKDVQTLIRKSNRNNVEEKKRKDLELIIKLQAHIRGFLVRRPITQRLTFLKSKSTEIIKIQAWWKSLLVQKVYRKVLEEKRVQRKSVIHKPQDLKAYYKSQERNIIRIQAMWRGRCARRAFLSLFHKKNPPFKVVKHFVPLLDFSTEDYEKEMQLQSLRADAVQAIRKNQQLSKQLDELDLKIGLLVQNRISLQDVVFHRTKLNDLVKKTNVTINVENFKANDSTKTSTAKTLLSTSTRGLKALTRESRKLLDGYQHLFYTLQTNPIYLSKLLFCLPQSRTNQFLQNVILTLYNFGSNTRDEYLLLKLFRSSLEEEINSRLSKPLDVISGNPIVLKMAVNHARQMNGVTSLRNIVGPLVEKMISDKSLSIDTSPIDIYKAWRNRMESQTGEISTLPHTVTQEQALSYEEVRTKLSKGLQTLKVTVTLFLDRITECRDMLPFSILYMARVLHHALSKKFPSAPEKEILKVIGHLVYYQFINAGIVAPDAFDIVTLPHDKALSNDQRRNLASVAKILHFSASKKGFGEESAHLQCLNPFIVECHEKMKNFFRQCCQGPSLEEHFSVDEYSEATLLYKPVIYISVQEICDTHSLLIEYEDIIAPDVSDHLHELLDALGPTDPGEVMPLACLVPLANTEVCLTLIDKFQLPADDLTDINKLFIKTKELCVSVLPFLNGDHLLEALCIGTTKQQQEQYKAFVQQKIYSGMIKPNENMTLREHIAQLRTYLNKLEDEGYVTREDGYQSIVTAIALDLCNKGKYRRGQLVALQMMKKTKQSLDQKTNYYEEQCEYYNQYINKCLENLNAGKRMVHSLDRNTKMPGKVKSKLCVKYSGSKLHEKGILIEIDGLSVPQFKNVLFEITPTDHNGIFNIKGKFLGVEVEKMELDVQHLLQLQYDGCCIMDLFGKAKINVNLLLFLLNSKFYGKTK